MVRNCEELGKGIDARGENTSYDRTAVELAQRAFVRGVAWVEYAKKSRADGQ